MPNFQRIILIFAIVLLIICLIFIGIVLVNSKNSEVWPPLVGDCPDYWVDLSGNGAECVNVKNLGTWKPSQWEVNSHQTVDFTQSPFTGSNGTCTKYNWAKFWGLTWDGITYGVPNPCNTTTSTTSS
jgi:hypothetical protein